MATPIPQLWYDSKGGYWLKDAAGNRFLSLDSSQVKRHLRRAGLNPTKPDNGGLSEVERALTAAELDRYVDYAGPLAGHRVGSFKTTDGKQVLITSECDPSVFERSDANPDKWPFLRRYFSKLVDDDQLPALLLWLAYAIRALRARDFRPGQMIVFAGPPTCGKSFMHEVITYLLGGRAGKPYVWMTGRTAFNQDIAESESLVIEDEQGHTDIRTRLAFKATIKQLTVNETVHVHGKGMKGVVLPTFRRLSLSVNDEAENLMILPPMDEDLSGKVMLFRCRLATSALSEDRTENKDRCKAELPALRAHLDKMRVPNALRDPRFGVVAHHDPDLLESISGLAPETRLLQLIDEVIWTNRKKKEESNENGGLEMSADELERELRNSPFNFAIDRLLAYPSACGVYLGRLALKLPGRFSKRMLTGRTIWTLKP